VENTDEKTDMMILPEKTIIEDLIPKKVCNFVPLKREEIYRR
jgi:hypothetical protein